MSSREANKEPDAKALQHLQSHYLHIQSGRPHLQYVCAIQDNVVIHIDRYCETVLVAALYYTKHSAQPSMLIHNNVVLNVLNLLYDSHQTKV